jgi:hypothetical protein
MISLPQTAFSVGKGEDSKYTILVDFSHRRERWRAQMDSFD